MCNCEAHKCTVCVLCLCLCVDITSLAFLHFPLASAHWLTHCFFLSLSLDLFLFLSLDPSLLFFFSPSAFHWVSNRQCSTFCKWCAVTRCLWATR